jgi:hypothetical protein
VGSVTGDLADFREYMLSDKDAGGKAAATALPSVKTKAGSPRTPANLDGLVPGNVFKGLAESR